MGIEDEPKIGQESWTTPDDIEILIVSAANISKVTIVSTGDRQVCLYLNCKSECLKRVQDLQKVNLRYVYDMTDTAARTKVTEMKRSANPKMESQLSASAPSGRAHIIALLEVVQSSYHQSKLGLN